MKICEISIPSAYRATLRRPSLWSLQYSTLAFPKRDLVYYSAKQVTQNFMNKCRGFKVTFLVLVGFAPTQLIALTFLRMKNDE